MGWSLSIRAWLPFACASALASAAPCAWAQAGHSLREALTGAQASDGRRHSEAPPIARYVSESGSTFVVDRSGADVLFKFDHSPEIWVLRQKPAPGGDVIYVNDVGDPVLRASRFGGVTLYSQERPMGAPAALEGPAPAFRPTPMSPQALLAKLQWASVKASEAAGRLIVFDADEITPGAEPMVADTASVVAGAFQRLGRFSGGQRALQRLRSVRIVQGRTPSVALRPSGVLDVVVVPERGVAGRPSSGRIIQAAYDGG